MDRGAAPHRENQRLSEIRADAVEVALVGTGVGAAQPSAEEEAGKAP